MSIFRNIVAGIKQGLQYKRVAFYIFLIQLFLSLLIGVLSINYVNSSIGSSTNLMKIIEGYNHDVFQDLLRFESTGWSMIKTFISLIIFVYILLGPFIMGGLLSCYHHTEDRWQVFWSGGSRLYFPFLKLNLLILFCLILVGGILSTIGFFFANYSLANMLTEIPTIVAICLLLFLLILYVIHIVSISTLAKWNMIRTNDFLIWRNFRKAAKVVRSRFGYYLMLGLLFFVLSLAFALLCNTVINCVSESNFLLMLVAFLLQLLVLFSRVFLRNGYYAALVHSHPKESSNLS